MPCYPPNVFDTRQQEGTSSHLTQVSHGKGCRSAFCLVEVPNVDVSRPRAVQCWPMGLRNCNWSSFKWSIRLHIHLLLMCPELRHLSTRCSYARMGRRGQTGTKARTTAPPDALPPCRQPMTPGRDTKADSKHGATHGVPVNRVHPVRSGMAPPYAQRSNCAVHESFWTILARRIGAHDWRGHERREEESASGREKAR